ncbi:MAG: hypothetical protein ABIP17_11095 [Ilumatobacteraceae bacterium]
MRNLLIVLTVIEILIFVGALAGYLIAISRTLGSISQSLSKVTFGVRAIETQCSSIGPSVVRVNEQLTVVAGALDGLVRKANQASGAS